MTIRACVLTVLAMLVSALPARAQESGQIGLSMGYPSAISVIWHVTDVVAVRPEFNFGGGSSESSPQSSIGSTISSSSKSSSSNYGVGISALIYVPKWKWDALRAYVSPRYVYARTKNTTEFSISLPPIIGLPPTISLPTPSTTSTTSRTTTFVGSFGAQYAMHKRFSAFGEVGYGYSTSKLIDSEPDRSSFLANPTSKSWGARSAAGVIFYF